MKLLLAPIQGMTIAHYRNLYNEIFGGIDAYYAPFIATSNPSKISDVLFKDLFPENNSNTLNVVPQLLGNSGSDFKYYASKIIALGYDEINWNIGCPYPMITKKKKGSGLLPYPEMIKIFLDEVCSHKSYDLSVKMRLGLNHQDEGLVLMDVLNQYPLKSVIIHGRLGVQKYNGYVDLDAFENLIKRCKHNITYNGDIFTYDDYIKIHNRFPAINHFMLGRGALRDPFLPATIKNKGVEMTNKIEKISSFHDGLYSYYKNILSGDKHLIDRMKEFWSYTAVHIDSSDKFMKKIKKSRSSDEYTTLVNQMLNQSSFN